MTKEQEQKMGAIDVSKEKYFCGDCLCVNPIDEEGEISLEVNIEGFEVVYLNKEEAEQLALYLLKSIK